MGIKFKAWLLGLLGLPALLVGCTSTISARPGPASGSVFFQIQPVQSTPTQSGAPSAWEATYKADGRVEHFRIELNLKNGENSSPIAFSKGAFLREPGSKTIALLRDLTIALAVQHVGPPDQLVDTLPFTVAILGRNLSRGSGKDSFAGGGFTSNPKGDWIATKVFVAGGAGEFYLNLNPATGEGEISIKDPEYGDTIMKELAKVFYVPLEA